MVEKEFKIQKVGIVGLGLMGGSLAKAILRHHDVSITGYDLNKDVLAAAKADKVIQDELTPNNMKELDVLFLALYPQAIVDFIYQNISFLKKGCIIMDLCGIKSYICAQLDDICLENHLHFIGGHPMAGREFSGYQYAIDTLFEKGSMIFVPTKSSTPNVLKILQNFLQPLGFSEFLETTPEKHDQMIAYTSQLAHIVSSSYIKSPSATEHHGFSAGSYRDMTRVARLNETMWTELFLKNSTPLLKEINAMIQHLTEYRNALQAKDEEELKELLKDGRERKELIDKNEY